MRGYALKWSAAGWRVIPLTPGDKKPLTAHGCKDGSTDAEIITAWWTKWPDANIGVCTGNGLVVLDVDTKDGKDGWQALAAVGITRELLDGLKTYTVTTPTLGSHYWFYSDEPVRGGQDVLGPGSGVDLRAEGGYIVAPPSRRPEGTYLVSYCGNACDSDQLPRLSKLASWSALGDKIHRPVPPPPPPRPSDPITDEELQQRVGRAKAFLGKCPEAVSGQGGHNQTFSVASALVNGFMLPPKIALSLLVADYNPRCQPPWSASELEHKVSSAQEKGPPEGKPYGWLLDGPNVPGTGHDRRTITSPVNGTKHTSIDWGTVAEEFRQQTGTVTLWRREGFYVYDKKRGVYRLYSDRELAALVGAFLKSGKSSTARYSLNAERNLVGALRATNDLSLLPPVFLSNGKSAAGWIAMRNGLLDVEAAARGEPVALRPPSSDFFSTLALPYDWNPEAECPRFLHFLESSVPDEESREMLQMLAGLLLVPDTHFQVFWILFGDGGCGKSTFLTILRELVGRENVCSVSLADLNEKFTKGELALKLANLVDDSPTVADGYRSSMAGIEGELKKITGGMAAIKLERKGQDPDTTRTVTARCVYCQNPPLPAFADRSDGLWRRIRLIPFPKRFDGTPEQNPRLADDIIAEELPGVLCWAIEGLGKLRKLKQFPQSPAGAAIIEEHRFNCDKEKQFLEECYCYMPEWFTSSADLNAQYKEWCENNGCGRKNSSNLKQDVLRVFPGVKYGVFRRYGGQQRGYQGLALSEEHRREYLQKQQRVNLQCSSALPGSPPAGGDGVTAVTPAYTPPWEPKK